MKKPRTPDEMEAVHKARLTVQVTKIKKTGSFRKIAAVIFISSYALIGGLFMSGAAPELFAALKTNKQKIQTAAPQEDVEARTAALKEVLKNWPEGSQLAESIAKKWSARATQQDAVEILNVARILDSVIEDIESFDAVRAKEKLDTAREEWVVLVKKLGRTPETTMLLNWIINLKQEIVNLDAKIATEILKEMFKDQLLVEIGERPSSAVEYLTKLGFLKEDLNNLLNKVSDSNVKKESIKLLAGIDELIKQIRDAAQPK